MSNDVKLEKDLKLVATVTEDCVLELPAAHAGLSITIKANFDVVIMQGATVVFNKYGYDA